MAEPWCAFQSGLNAPGLLLDWPQSLWEHSKRERSSATNVLLLQGAGGTEQADPLLLHDSRKWETKITTRVLLIIRQTAYFIV